jgi:hypothetical protein
MAKGELAWSERFTMADTPGYPDTNCCMFIDPRGRLWLLWPTILANRWETALMKYQIASEYERDGPPGWESSHVLHVTPGEDFAKVVNAFAERTRARIGPGGIDGVGSEAVEKWLSSLQLQAGDKLQRRLGWMTRAHPFVLEGKRLIVPLYSDGFSFSLMAISDDWGRTWTASSPLIGGANIQPSIVQRKDGSLYTLMRDNGPAPKRLHESESRDRGMTWSPVRDSDLPNPGSGAEIISLRNGHWVLIGNDTERGRYSLAVRISDDEGKTWKWTRHLERETAGAEAGAYHYPSIIQARDGTLHASYSFHLGKAQGTDAQGQPARKAIKHAHFNEAWVMEGDRP